MKLTESQKILANLKESIDVSSFDISSNSIFMKPICELAGCAPEDIKECIGYVFNDYEPEDFVLEMNDGTTMLVNTARGGHVSKFSDRQTAINVLFNDGANYNF